MRQIIKTNTDDIISTVNQNFIELTNVLKNIIIWNYYFFIPRGADHVKH